MNNIIKRLFSGSSEEEINVNLDMFWTEYTDFDNKVGSYDADLFPDLIVFTSPHERSAAPIPSTFDVTLHATNPRTFVKGSEYF